MYHNSCHCATVYYFRGHCRIVFFTCCHMWLQMCSFRLLFGSPLNKRPEILSPMPFCLNRGPLEKIQRLKGLLGHVSPGRIWPRMLLQMDLYLIPHYWYLKLFHNMAAKATWYRPSVRSCMVRMETDLLKVHIFPTKSSSCCVDQHSGLGEGRSCLSWNSIS